MTPEEEPFASFAGPREKPSAVEAWKRRRVEETRQWKWLTGVGWCLLVGTFLGSAGASPLTGSLVGAGVLVLGASVGMPLGLAVGWLAGFGSWGGRVFRGTRLVAASDTPVPILWLALCCGVGLVTGAAIGSVALPHLLLDADLADRTDVAGPVGACAGAAFTLLLVWLRGGLRPPGTPISI
jgi:hypothetical protein